LRYSELQIAGWLGCQVGSSFDLDGARDFDGLTQVDFVFDIHVYGVAHVYTPALHDDANAFRLNIPY
jgi:hypothetical protein